MTERARLVLSDAEAALAELEECQNIPYADEGLLRRRYVALMALLRAVGNVLNDADKPRAPSYLQDAIEEKWRDLSSDKPPIFRFITDKRSAVVKRYDMPENDPDRIAGTDYPRLTFYPTAFAKSQLEGFYSQMLVVDVARIAIDFWKDYLDQVDGLSARYKDQ